MLAQSTESAGNSKTTPRYVQLSEWLLENLKVVSGATTLETNGSQSVKGLQY